MCRIINTYYPDIDAIVSASECGTIMVPDCIEPTDELRSLCFGVYDSLLDVMEAIKREEI